ncbi:hypothetical protein DFP72DRAFT_887128 [Ephemerocybe angulata]|uniref:Uncharacterized protein n=1 Tax=Ephemerocybe angulata TaxID=980116 RepID=A0A8H6I4W9_9AGAR|nr:hypothetical protein DFP72DRAFT_887128 [Tulosesus angulatus]
MCLYGLIVFLETPRSLRKGRTLYILVSFTILGLSIMSTVSDNYSRYLTLYNALPGDAVRTKAAMDRFGAQGSPEYVVARVTSTFVAFIGDGLLLYRCFFFWGDRKWVVILPALVYAASVGPSVIPIFLSESHIVSVMGFLQMLWVGVYPGWRIDFSVAWIALNASLNVLITALISFRLLVASYRNSQLLPSFSSKVYLSVVAILVEAALPLSVCGIALASFITQTRGAGAAKPHQGFFRIMYFFFLAISPQMIIFRVTTGRGLSRHGGVRNHGAGGEGMAATTNQTHPVSTALDFSNSTNTQSVGDDYYRTEATSKVKGNRKDGTMVGSEKLSEGNREKRSVESSV